MIANKRKIFLAIGVVVIFSLVLFVFLFLKNSKKPIISAFGSEPVALFLSSDLKTDFNNLKRINFWNKLEADTLLFFFKNNTMLLDTGLMADPEISKCLNQVIGCIGVMPLPGGGLDAILVFRPNKEANLKRVFENAKKEKYVVEKRKTYVGTLYEIIRHQGSITFGYNGGLCVVSGNASLVEDAMARIEIGKDNLFESGYKIREPESGTPAKLYLNYAAIRKIGAGVLQMNHQDKLDFASRLGLFSEFEIHSKGELTEFKGGTYLNTGDKDFLSAFRNQKPSENRIADVLPGNTAYLMSFSFDSTKQFVTKLTANNLPKRGTQVPDAENYFLNWMGQEVCLFITEPSSSDLDVSTFVAIKINNRKLAQASLDKLRQRYAIHDEFDLTQYVDSMDTDTFGIRNISAENLLYNLFGRGFDLVTKNYYAFSGNYVYFSNSRDQLSLLLQEVTTGKVLSKNSSYKSFFSKLPGGSNLLIYAKSNSFFKPLESILDERIYEKISRNTNLRSFNQMCISYSFVGGNKFATSFAIENLAKPVKSAELEVVWNAMLDAEAITMPMEVKLSRARENIFFIQDANYSLYCFTSGGKLLWKKLLVDKVMGNVHSVDMFKNGETQFLFNTSNEVHLMNVDGDYLLTFPKRLPRSASAPLSVYNFDNTNKLFYYIPCGNYVYGYDITGKPIPTWNPMELTESVNFGLDTFSKKGNTYLYTSNSSGDLFLWNRYGKRIEASFKFPGYFGYPFFMRSATKRSGGVLFSVDSTSVIHYLTLDSLKLRNLPIKQGVILSALAANVIGNNGSDLIVQYPDKIGLTDFTNRSTSSINFNGTGKLVRAVNLDPNNSMFVFSSDIESTTTAIDLVGRTIDGFPVNGTSAGGFLVESGGAVLFCTIHQGRKILCYKFTTTSSK